MDNLKEVGRHIIEKMGGLKNLVKVEHCMTRIRIEVVNDNAVMKTDLIQIKGIKGYIKQGKQHQLIAGPGAAAKLTGVIQQLVALVEETNEPPETVQQAKAMAKKRYTLPISAGLKQLAAIFIPLIPAFIASGLLVGISNFLKRPDLIPSFSLMLHYPNAVQLFDLFGNTIFSIMNVLVGVNTARALGGSMSLGGVMAGILSHQGLSSITLFDNTLAPGRGGVIAVLLVVAFMCWVEARLRKLLPESAELILNPLLTTLITGTIAIVILQPIGGFLAEGIAQGAMWALDNGGLLVGGLLSGAFLPLVLSGLHQGLIPIYVELIQTEGINPLLPILSMAGMGQVGAALAVLMRTDNRRLKKLTKGALPVGLLGIGEPLIFGVTLPLGRPFIAACIGGAFGGALISYCKVATVITFGISGLPLALTIVSGKILLYLIGVMVSISMGFICTLVLGFREPSNAH